MNILDRNKKILLIHMHVEGIGVRSISRILDISTNTVQKNIEQVSSDCKGFLNLFPKIKTTFKKQIDSNSISILYYNFCLINKRLRTTPAMESGICNDIMEIEDLVFMKKSVKFKKLLPIE